MSCCEWTGRNIFQTAGGGQIAGNPVFENISELSDFSVEPSQNGLVVWVLSVQDAFVYQNDSALPTVDNITIVPARSGVGQWIRLKIPNERWAEQATWYINATDGNDENGGATRDAPLRSHAELARRVNGLMLRQTTITIIGSLGEVLHLDVTLSDGSHGAPIGRIDYIGEGATPLWQSILTSSQFLTVIGIHDNIPAAVEDTETDWATAGPDSTSLVGHRIRITAGDREGATAWLAQIFPDNPNWVRTSPFLLASEPVDVEGGDAYIVESLPTVYGVDLHLRRRTGKMGEPIQPVACTITGLALSRPEPRDGVYFNSRLKSDDADVGFLLSDCWVEVSVLELDRGELRNCRLLAPNVEPAEEEPEISEPLRILGNAVTINAGLLLECTYIFDTPCSVRLTGNHLVQGFGHDSGAPGMVVRAPVIDLDDVAFFDCSPAIIVESGAGLRVGFRDARADLALWGLGNSLGMDVTAGAVAAYRSQPETFPPPVILATGADAPFRIGGVSAGYGGAVTLPYFNSMNGAGFVLRDTDT